MTFENLGLSTKVIEAVASAGFTAPTPIQSQAIPWAVQGRDVIGIAQTGTGKTASFVLPMLNRLESGRARARMPRSLILEPTRELAAQVQQSFEQLGVNHKLTLALLIGGVSFDDQNRILDRGADVLIATPGRLLDQFGRGKLLLSAVEIVVIDEADRMLDMGFIPDIERICKLLPANRQTLFFSATMPPEVKKLADKFLNNPERVEVSRPSSTATTIIQRLKFTSGDPKIKREVLRELIRADNVRNAIIFCNRKRDVGIMLKSLQKHGFNAGALHGDMDQRARMATLDAFRNGEITYLAASDVAARGLDIPDVSHVFNFDVPVSPEDYVHRIGRTGRAGREGFAAMLVSPADLENVRAIEKLSHQKIEWIDGEPTAEDIEAARALVSSERRGRQRRGRFNKGEAPANTVHNRTNGETPSRSRRRPTPSKKAPAIAKDITDVPTNQPTTVTRSKPVRERPAKQPDVNLPTKVVQNIENPWTETVARKKDAHRSNTRRERKEPVVIGLGEHVPAFLMTPIRRSKSSTQSE